MKLSDVKIVQKKTLIMEKIYHNDLGGHARCKDSITNKKVQAFVRVGEIGSTYCPGIFGFNL
jgi:hypothetical protein